ncbi:MAG TPA: YdcF family protein [Bacteroidales bacterium]|nr:YdcF family protein [Bacteroidales bacterium]
MILWLGILALGLLGMIDSFVLLMVSSLNVGVVLPGLAGMLMAAESLSRLGRGRSLMALEKPLVKKTFAVVVSLWLISLIIVEGIVISGQHSQENINADYLIVLGAGLKNGNLSKTLASRMNKALDYLKSHEQTKVIVTGGRGKDEKLSEAEAMARFLIAHHIDTARILKEEHATSTIENLRFSKTLIDKDRQGKEVRIALLTNDFHMFRAKLLAKRAGLEVTGITAQTPISVRYNCYLREYFALIKSYFMDK